TSTSRASSVTELAATAPAATSSATGSGATSKTPSSTSSVPASRSAIGLPMLPRPTKPTRTAPTSGPEGLAAVDGEDLPGHPRRLVGEQEEAGSHHVLGLAHPLQGKALHQLLGRVAGLGAGGLGVGGAGG